MIPGISSLTLKKAVGTVTDIQTSTSSSRSQRTGNSYSTGSTTVKIQFRDEKDHIYEVSCYPIFNTFKEHDSVKISYLLSSFDEKQAEYWKKGDPSNPTYHPAEGVEGTPISIYYWLERPVIFILIALVLLILRLPVGQLRNTFP
jgi:hypothetical protein